MGIEWSPHPTAEEARCEYDRIWSQLRGRSIEELVDLPSMSDCDAAHSAETACVAGSEHMLMVVSRWFIIVIFELFQSR
jgi:hypothetical protein